MNRCAGSMSAGSGGIETEPELRFPAIHQIQFPILVSAGSVQGVILAIEELNRRGNKSRVG